MATVIGLMGETGSGKTTSIRNLNPDSTYYINADGKKVLLPGFSGKYNRDKKNYKNISDVGKIKTLIENIAKKAPHIKVVIVDTVNAIMLDDEMARSKQTGYDKWINLASSIYELINFCNKEIPDHVYIILMFHEETFLDDDGVRTTRILTNGKKLEKIKLETKLPILLRSMSIDRKSVV